MELTVQNNGQTKTIGELSEGDEGTAETIAAIQAIIDHACFIAPGSAMVQNIARDLMVAANNDVQSFALELWHWARNSVSFKRDPSQVELVRHPRTLLESIAKSGQALCDCDDLATLLASIIAAAGSRPVLITVGKLRRPAHFAHIFVGIYLGGELAAQNIIPLDPQENTPAGSWPDVAKRVKYWRVTVTPPK